MILFIPFTYFLLTDKFQIAVVLIIVLLGINVFTSTITIFRYLPKVFTSSLNQVKVLSLLVNFVNLALYLLVILLGIYKLKKDIDLLPSIIVPLNKGKGDNYYTRLEKKCLELQQELEKQKDNFENNEELVALTETEKKL